MSNTITNTRTVCGKDLVVQQVLLVSDGSEETDLVIYDSSAVATALGKTDPLKCTLMRIQLMQQNAATYSTFTVEQDASTDVIVAPLALYAAPGAGVLDIDFSSIGGIPWIAGSGSTGDLVLTTSALDSGDVVMMILHVKPY